MKTITTSAPGKLLLFGDHAVVYGQPCIVTAVDQRIHVNIHKNGIDAFQLDAPDLGLHAYTKLMSDLGKKELPKAVSFIEMCYKRFLEKYPQKEGIVVTTKSDFSSQFGFGSSSAVTVAFAKALMTLYELEVTQKELFDMCYQAILDVQGVGSGFDIAAAIWGGTIYYKKPASVVEQLRCDDLPLVVGYTGIKADTPTIVRMIETAYKKEPKKIGDIFSQIGEMTDDAKECIETKNWSKAGKCMNENQELLQKLGVSSVQLENLISAARGANAYGAKLSGAGGGDCMVAFVSNEKRGGVEKAITKAGGQVLHVVSSAAGARREV